MARRMNLQIGRLDRLNLKTDPAQTQVRQVTVKQNGTAHRADVQFTMVNRKAIWCFPTDHTEEAFAVINGALSQRGERKLFKVLAEDTP